MATTTTLLLILSLFFPIQSSTETTTIDPIDFLALQSIPKSLSDLPGSQFFSLWDFTTDPCTFPGVLCSGPHVVSLSLGDPRAGSPGLSGHLPPSLSHLSALSELSLVPGRVTGPIPNPLSLSSSLRFVALSRNFLSGPIPPSLSSLPLLRTLDLSFNILSGQIPPSIASLPALSNLVLSHNRLSGPIPSFPASSRLLRLDVNHNNISGEIPALPGSIRHLACARNRLSGGIGSAIPPLTMLSYLDLSANFLSGPVPSAVFGLPLSFLRLQRNNLSGAVEPPGDVRIPEVDLSYNRLSGEVSPFLATVGRLYLNNNRFAGELPGRFGERLEAAGMEVLYLQHNFLCGFRVSPAAEIPMTASLCLQYNCMVPPVEAPCPAQAGLQKTRPVNQCPEWRV